MVNFRKKNSGHTGFTVKKRLKKSVHLFVSGRIRFMPVSYPVHVQNFPPDKTDRDVRLMNGRYPIPYCLFGTRVLHLL